MATRVAHVKTNSPARSSAVSPAKEKGKARAKVSTSGTSSEDSSSQTLEERAQTAAIDAIAEMIALAKADAEARAAEEAAMYEEDGEFVEPSATVVDTEATRGSGAREHVVIDDHRGGAPVSTEIAAQPVHGDGASAEAQPPRAAATTKPAEPAVSGKKPQVHPPAEAPPTEESPAEPPSQEIEPVVVVDGERVAGKAKSSTASPSSSSGSAERRKRDDAKKGKKKPGSPAKDGGKPGSPGARRGRGGRANGGRGRGDESRAEKPRAPAPAPAAAAADDDSVDTLGDGESRSDDEFDEEITEVWCEGAIRHYSEEYDFTKRLHIAEDGAIFKGIERRTGREVAIKLRHCTEPGDVERGEREHMALAAFQGHPLFQQLIHMSYNPMLNGQICVTEFVTAAKIRKKDPEAVRRYMWDLITATECMHACGFVNRDIKPDNAILDAVTGNAVLIDFDSAMQVHLKPFSHSGTFEYMAPEVEAEDVKANRRYYGLECDIWSLGITLGNLLFYKERLKRNDILMFKHLKKIATRVQTPGTDLMMKMLQHKPKKRITAAQALKHPYFDGLNRKNPAVDAARARCVANKEQYKRNAIGESEPYETGDNDDEEEYPQQGVPYGGGFGGVPYGGAPFGMPYGVPGYSGGAYGYGGWQ